MGRFEIRGSGYAIRKIFSDDFAFAVPLYQRPYAWTTEEAGELLEDLIDFMEASNVPRISDRPPYFLGSVVLIKGDDPDAQIVDGQQRLTTLTILLAVLRYLRPEYAADLTTFLYEKGSAITGTPNRYRLQLRERDAQFFQEYIQDEGGIEKLRTLNSTSLSDSQRNIQDNAMSFLDRLKKIPEKQINLAQFIANRCFLVIVSTPDLESAYRIFSVLNDRGMDLSHTDILKAEIIGQISQDQRQEEYTNKWEDMEANLGREAFEDLFAYIRMIYRKAKLRDSVLREFRQYVRPAEDPEPFIDEVLLPFADAFAIIKNAAYQSDTLDDEVNGLLRWLNRIDNADWIPPAILYLSRNLDNPAALVRFFADLERLAAGLMIRRANINERIERYRRLLIAIEDNADLYAGDSPLQLTSHERNDILDILSGELYLMEKIRLYVLLRLDAVLSEGEATYKVPIISVEHVLPQKPKPDSIWLKWFPRQQDRERYIHCLGNLVLLSRRKNSQAKNYEFDQKKQRYFAGKKGTSSFALTTQVLSEKEWTSQVIERRQQELIVVLKEIWRLSFTTDRKAGDNMS